MMFVRRRSPEWRHEDGPGYELRQYRHGRPTGVVATTAWDVPPGAGRDVISGPDVWLIREPTRITVVERQDSGYGAVRLRIPLRSCQDVTIVDEPGLPGAALVRVTLTVRLGARATVVVPLWLAGGSRPALEDLARGIRGREPTQPPPASVPTLTRLQVDQAPDDDDWIVFRPSRSHEDVVVPR
jgi:hypothetical protein